MPDQGDRSMSEREALEAITSLIERNEGYGDHGGLSLPVQQEIYAIAARALHPEPAAEDMPDGKMGRAEAERLGLGEPMDENARAQQRADLEARLAQLQARAHPEPAAQEHGGDVWQELIKSGGRALAQARGALRLDAMVDDSGEYYGTTVVALEALDDFESVLRHAANAAPEPAAQEDDMTTETLESQVDRLAKFIVENVPGEPSRSEGAIDTAIRLLGEPAAARGESRLDVDAHLARGGSEPENEIPTRVEDDWEICAVCGEDTSSLRHDSPWPTYSNHPDYHAPWPLKPEVVHTIRATEEPAPEPAAPDLVDMRDRSYTDGWEAHKNLVESEPAAARKAVVEAARTAVKELGVPGEGYPAPVANAHSILTAALARLEAEEGGVTIIEDEWACPDCEDASAVRDDGMFQFCDRHAAEFDAEEAGDG